ncbi:MAG: glycosyltransferase family 10 [Bacteroidota bacterium]
MIKVFFVDFWPVFDIKNNYFCDLLKQKYEIELDENEPDFLFYSIFGTKHKYYSCKKIFFTGENVRPDFSECDYAFTFDFIENNPRHYRLPLYPLFGDCNQLLKEKNPEEIIKQKNDFCCFVNSNPTPKQRIKFFKKLSEYKKVNSGGRVLNNLGYRVADKMSFMRKHKFTIAYENNSFPGYTTEKIFEPMLVNSVPIYWGNPLVHLDFNPKSFINAHDYSTEEELIERIIEIDNNDKLYLEMLAEPYFTDNKVNRFIDNENILKQFDYIFKDKTPPITGKDLIHSQNPFLRISSKAIIEAEFLAERLMLKINNFDLSKIKNKFQNLPLE